MSLEIANSLFNVNYENVKKIFFSSGDFFVLLDSLALVLEASLNKHLKWTSNGSGAYLHCIYCIERTLEMLLKLKPNIKIAFFRNVEAIFESCERQSGRNDFTLLYELVLWHLKSLDMFKNKLVFFDSFADYVSVIKDERIVCYMAFSYVDLTILANENLARMLKSHVVNSIRVNLNLGVNVIFTKNFWYDSSCANAFFVTKKKRQRPVPVEETLIWESDQNLENYVIKFPITRESLYAQALEDIHDSKINYLLKFHLNLLDKLSLEKRASIGYIGRQHNSTDMRQYEEKYAHVNQKIQTFKFSLAHLLKCANRKFEFVELSRKTGAQIIDIFDARLFWKTYEALFDSNDNNISAAIFETKVIKQLPEDKLDVEESKEQARGIKKPFETAHSQVNCKLFRDFLGDQFRIIQSNGVENAYVQKFDSVLSNSSASKSLDEYESLISGLKSSSQWQATNFARYLENYAKSFRFNYSEPSIYEFISNQLEKPFLEPKGFGKPRLSLKCFPQFGQLESFVAAASNGGLCRRWYHCPTEKGKNSAKWKESSKAPKKTDLIIQQANVKKYEESVKKDQKTWLATRETLSNKNDLKATMQLILNSLNACKTWEVKLEIFKIYLDLKMKKFMSLDSQSSKILTSLDYYKACESSLRAFREDSVKKELSEKYEKEFKMLLKEIGFHSADNKNTNQDMIHYQLTHAEFCLHRENFSREDFRVDDFKPDPWQCRLMDAIDRRKTVIVSAPTSSGKTFSSFYAMKITLRSSDDDMTVYVAPTKALVNQMMAGVYARFKAVELTKNKKLIGVFTRDYQENIFNCRILLTVPECLEILFFSPRAQSDLIKRIKYIIFDEFQMINDEDRGKIWERVVLLSECPFLALSATIDKPAMLRNWLATAKKTTSMLNRARSLFINTNIDDENTLLAMFGESNLRSDPKSSESTAQRLFAEQLEPFLFKHSSTFRSLQKCSSISDKLHKIRSILTNLNTAEKALIVDELNLDFNDVILIDFKQSPTDFVYYSFVYENDKSQSENNIIVEKIESPVLSKFSPLSCLNENGKNLKNIVECIDLTPSDTFRLYECLKKTHPNVVENVATISEISHFRDSLFINRNQVKQFEANLKTGFLETHNKETSPLQIDTPYKQLVENLTGTDQFIQVPFNAQTDLPLLVEYMTQTKMLPCLAFAFTRTACEEYVKILLDYYERKEEHLRRTKYADKIRMLEARRALENAAKKKNRDKEKNSKPDEIEDLRDEPEPFADYTLLDEWLPECMLGEKRVYSRVEIETELDRAFDNRNDWRRRAIQRGFAYHHAGLNAKKRVCVESFFRNKFIQLVFCTSTLAQGIHVPCKSVIFIEDSIFLNVGTFKQCAGRAGRRGFDNHASCIFLNIPEIKCKQLVSSRSAQIHPSFIISPSFVLKLFYLCSRDESSIPNVMNLLNNGLMMYMNRSDESFDMRNKFYFMFCTEFLIKNSLLSAAHGDPIGLHKFVTYFQYHEPSNLAFAHLIRKYTSSDGNRLLSGIRDDDQLDMQILVVLSHLFNRLFIYDVEAIRKEHKANTWNSFVVLEDICDEFKRSLREFNQNTQAIFMQNLTEQSEIFDSRLDYFLPLSKYDYMIQTKNKALERCLDVDHVEDLKTRITSKFASLSNFHDEHDEFRIENKSAIVHMKPFYLDFQDLYPTVDWGNQTDFYGNRVFFNSYLIDFYKHECYASIVNENGLRDEVAYENMRDFKKLLSLLATMPGENRFMRAIRRINVNYSKKLDLADFDSLQYRNHKPKK